MTDTKYGGLTVAELRARLERATAAPWRAMRDGNQYVGCYLYDGTWSGGTLVGASRLDGPKRPWSPFYVVPAHEMEEVARFTDEDADLIAAMHAALPALLSAVEGGRETCDAGAVASTAGHTGPMVERVARAVYAENGWLRIVAPDDDGNGRYREHQNSQNRMRYIEWEELDADDKDSRLREACAAIAAMPSTAEKALREALELALKSMQGMRGVIDEAAAETWGVDGMGGEEAHLQMWWPKQKEYLHYADQDIAAVEAALASPSTEGWRGMDDSRRDVGTSPIASRDHLVSGERNARQDVIARWCAAAFGNGQASSLPQRGVRLLEEAVEAYQAAGAERAMAHKLIDFVFDRPAGTLAQELGGVGVTVLALANAGGLSADAEEALEVARVLAKPLAHFTARNQAKNDTGFAAAPPAPEQEGHADEHPEPKASTS